MPVTISATLRNAEQYLAAAGITTPALDARLLLEYALGLDRAGIFAQGERVLKVEEINHIDKLIARRAAHEPVGRIIGEREFWSLTFGLNEATLEPRPDSETLVEITLKALRDKTTPRLLDLGTGTGCLLLSLLHELPQATGIGIDIAPRAVAQATANAEKLGLASRARFTTGNWLDGIAETFDAIISNPPYIPAAEIAGLMPEVREHDPLRALDGGHDGLGVYRLLIPQMPSFLKPGGFAVFEVGQGQSDAVADLCRVAGFKTVTKHKDLNGIERCVLAH